MGVKDEVLLSREQSYRRTRDILAAAEARIAVLKAKLAESEQYVVGLSNGEVPINTSCVTASLRVSQDRIYGNVLLPYCRALAFRGLHHIFHVRRCT